MILLHSIGESSHPNVNTLEEIKNAKGILTFDGIYKSVYENRRELKDRDIILFVMGDYVGLNNDFDRGRHYKEDYCTWKEIEEMQKMGFTLGWHTWSHRDLTKLSDEEIEAELICPFETEHFAYPYGIFDDRVINIVKKSYRKAYSVDKGGESDYKIKRDYVNSSNS